MSIEERPLVSSVRERDIDLQLVQLLETSPSFREWFLDQFAPDREIKRYLSVMHSVGRIHGESDIEIGVETVTGERVLVLIENKIDAEVQDSQGERYFKRGEKYVESGLCDDYAVGLVAPEQYVNTAKRDAFGTVLTYETVNEQLTGLSHEAVPFVQDLLDLAVEKQASGTDAYPKLAQAITEAFHVRTDEFPPIQAYETKNNLVKFRSTHPDHPETVTYSIWIQGPSEGKQTMIRLGIDSDAPEDEIRAKQTHIADEFRDLDGFELRSNSTMFTVRTIIGTNSIDGQSRDEYVNRIIAELSKLTNHYHPHLTG